MIKLSERMAELVSIVGGSGASYAEAAERMGGLSIDTVQEYATQVRDRAGLHHLKPRDALFMVWIGARNDDGPTMP